MTSQDALHIQGTYNTLYNAITRPDRKFVVTHYFLDEWVPVLGPSLAWLVVALRQRCFWNRRHDWCIVDKATLARDAAMQERTIERSLRKPFSRWFIINVTHRYRYRTDLGKKVRDKNRYQLLLDEPLSPRHQRGLADLLHETVSANADPIEAALSAVRALLETPNLTGKISYTGKIDRKEPRRTILELVAEALDIDLIDYATDERLALLDRGCAQLHNEIVRPNKIYVGWQYFRLNWAEYLGHALSWIIIYLRRRCFWDEESGELRETCSLFKKDLAKAIGQTPRNLNNLLDNPYIPLFFTAPGPDDPVYGSEAGQKARRKGPALYRVRLVDEPLIPADQQRIAAELQRRLQGEHFGADREQGQLNLFPIIDRASNRQNFAYGQTEEKMTDSNAQKSRVGDRGSEGMSDSNVQKSRIDDQLSENLSGWWEKESRLGGDVSENLSDRRAERDQPDLHSQETLVGRWEKKSRVDTETPEHLSDRKNPQSRPEEKRTENLSGRWQKKSRVGDVTAEKMSSSQRKKSRLMITEPEKMSQHEQSEIGKNVATLKDSLILLESKREQQQSSKLAAEDLLHQLGIQEPVRSRLLNDSTITFTIIKAWHLYAATQPGLKSPESYVIKRLLAHDIPPDEFLTFAGLDEENWMLFERVAQAMYSGQAIDRDLPLELTETFVRWVEIYYDLAPAQTRLLLSSQRANRANQTPTTTGLTVPATQENEWADRIWRLILDQLQFKMTKSTFDTWLRQTSGLAYDNGVFVIGVQNVYAKDWLENRLVEMIERALIDIIGEPVSVEFIVLSQRKMGVG